MTSLFSLVVASHKWASYQSELLLNQNIFLAVLQPQKQIGLELKPFYYSLEKKQEISFKICSLKLLSNKTTSKFIRRQNMKGCVFNISLFKPPGVSYRLWLLKYTARVKV